VIAEKPTLQEKIDKRIVQMVKEGGLIEAFELFD
jgi:hypothetical protein